MARGDSDDKSLQCWGRASCPLVPAALRRAAGEAPAPESVQAAFGRPLKLADLDATIWANGSGELDKASLGDLVKALTPLLRAHAAARLVETGPPLPAVDAAALAVPAQTARLVSAATQGRPLEVAMLTFGDLLAMPSVGPRRTLELACAVEAHLAGRDDNDGRPAQTAAETASESPPELLAETLPNGVPVEPTAPTVAANRIEIARPVADAIDFAATMVQDRSDVGAPEPDESLIGTIVPAPGERREQDRRRAGATPREIKTFFRVLAAWASGERGEQTLQHALPQAKPGWPPELVQLWKRVRYCSAAELAGTLRDRYAVPDLLQQAFAGCDQRHRLILQARVLTTTKPTSLEALAPALRMSVDEVRALQRVALGYLERLQTKPFRPISGRARLIRERLGCAVPERDNVLRQALDWVVADFGDFPDLDFARELMLWLAGPYRLKDRWFVISADLPIRTVQSLLPHRNRDGVIETSVVRKVLSSLAIHPKYHEAWIDRVGEFVGVADGLMLASDRLTGRLPAMPPR